MYSDAIKDFMEVSSFGLRHQYQQLNQFPKPILAIFCSRLGYGCSLTKLKLIVTIIAHYFKSLLIIDPIVIQIASEQLKAEVKEAYGSLQMWNIDDKPDMCDFRNAMFSLLENYHRKAFGLSYSQQLINDIIGRDGLTMVPFTPVFQPAVPPVAVAVVAVVAVARSSKSHLKKLKIKVTLDKKLGAQECFMCCDLNKPFARLGCSHEYCVDCVVKCAKVRTKSFIICAICRAEVAEVQVGNAELKKSFAAQLKKE
jgi:hypothetical protein